MDWLIENIKKADSKIAIIYKNKSFSYKQLRDKIVQYSIILKKSVPEGSVVAIVSDYNFYSISLFLALVNNKNIIIPLIASITKEEQIINLEIGYAEYVVNIDDTGELSFKDIKIGKTHDNFDVIKRKNDSGLVLFSSGTTGEPKAMIHNLSNILDGFRNKRTNNLTILVFLLFDHIGGLNTLLSALSATSTLTLVHDRKPEIISQLIQKNGVNILPTTPTFLNLLLISKTYLDYDLSSLKLITYGTEFMPESLLIRLKREFPNVKFIQTFGTSETGIISTKSLSSNSNLLKIDDPKISYKIINNILFIKSKTQVSGYLNQESDNFDNEGWFNTGDIVEETKDGFLKILARKDNIINIGGEKVFPTEVENHLMKLPFILDCMVYGKPNPITGQSVVADVLLQKDYQKIKAKKEIRKFFKQTTARFKTPTKINFINSIDYSDRFKKIRNKT
jgi:acyl-coenzyme A synthetase/AMP-(fatty) acid ligase